MPISGPSSYPAATREFLDHWENVDSFLGAGNTLVLAGGATVDILGDLLGDLDSSRDLVTDAGVDRTLARQELNGHIELLQGRMVEFNRRVRADLAGTAYERSLEDVFSTGQSESTVRQALRYMSRLWLKINAMTAPPAAVVLPMVLIGGYTLAAFNAERVILRTAYGTLGEAEVDLRLAREQRNDLQESIYAILKGYRLKVPTVLPAGNALLDSLPALTPPEGHTPVAVVAQAVFNPATTQADLTWSASTDADLKEYEIRGVPGDDYVTDDEAVLGSVPAGGVRSFSTAFALGTPGLTAGFKAYVVLKSGREKGSEPLYVTRPTP